MPLAAHAQVAPLATPAPPTAAGKGADRRIDLTVAVLVNGASVGEITVNTDRNGNATIDAARLIELVRPLVTTAVTDNLSARAAGGAMVPVETLNGTDFKLLFDLASLRVLVDIPIDARATNDISLLSGLTSQRATLTQPADFSAGVTFSIADRFRHVDGLVRDIDREGLTALAEGFVNVGGIDGVNLTFQGGYREGGRVARQRTTLFHDDVSRAIRYSAGDVDPQTFGAFGNSIGLLGISAERLYQDIQPYRNLRPSGRGAITIERPSRVDVLVNGTLYRTLSLAPGQYNIRDFPFLDGLNDVQLVVRDDAGREEAISLSFFTDTELLDPGINIFSAALGFRRNQFGSFTNTSYEETPTFSGFFRTGLSDRLTVGASAQADRRNAMTTGQVVVGTDFGLFGFEGALDLNKDERAQVSYLFSYRLRGQDKRGLVKALDLNVQYQSARFSPMEAAGLDRNRFSYEANARYQTSIDTKTFLTLGASYLIGRDAQPDVRAFNAGMTRRFNRVSVGLNYSYRDDALRSDHRVGLTISIPLTRRQFVRAGYDSDRNRVFADYDLNGLDGLNETSARVSLARDDDGRSANLDVEHNSNRFRAFLRHDYTVQDGTRSEFTDVGASVGFGYADGQIAIGRDASRGFAIVAAHPTLKNAQVTVFSNYTLGPAARTGVFGPALVPTQRPYQPNSLRVEVDDLAPGYDIGAGRYDILPGAASGYAIVIGSAASNTVMGRLYDAAGKPIEFASGTLVPLSGADAEPVPFFTNRTGRMAASRVAPGRYHLLLSGQTVPIGEIEVSASSNGIVDIGELHAGRAK